MNQQLSEDNFKKSALWFCSVLLCVLSFALPCFPVVAQSPRLGGPSYIGKECPAPEEYILQIPVSYLLVEEFRLRERPRNLKQACEDRVESYLADNFDDLWTFRQQIERGCEDERARIAQSDNHCLGSYLECGSGMDPAPCGAAGLFFGGTRNDCAVVDFQVKSDSASYNRKERTLWCRVSVTASVLIEFLLTCDAQCADA
ncbi:MAG: hypothetical protein KDD64_12235 [Bdellovibrionales bacterium]|nr:hypothetical protein [Bdellovibrionales bacterium]